MYGVNSILQYISASFNNSILNDQGVLLPNALIAIYFFGFFISELLKKNNTFIKKFFSFFVLSYMFIEANRYSEYGNDIPGLLFFLFVIYSFLGLKKLNISNKEFEIYIKDTKVSHNEYNSEKKFWETCDFIYKKFFKFK